VRKFGLIGFPLGHSFSKKFFTAKFENENIDARYDLYELENISLFADLKLNPDLYGLNVTIPYKEKVIAFLDELDDTAQKIGAVNVIKFIRAESGLRLKGYNSDAIGFRKSIQPLIKPHHKKALILGTGGASKAANYILNGLNIDTVFVSRTPAEGIFTYQQLDEKIMDEFTIIVNTSPVGTFPNIDKCPDIPYHLITNKHLLYDVVYNPSETLFMQKGKAMGANVKNGEEMLNGQAVAAWEIWNSTEK